PAKSVTTIAFTPMNPDSNWLQSFVAGPLELSDFAVILIESSGFRYIPTGRLRETTGTSRITVASIDFHLNGIGALGNVPRCRFHMSIPAGGSVDLNPLVYGDYSFEVSSTTYATSLIISVHFFDDAGRAGMLTATDASSQSSPVGYR